MVPVVLVIILVLILLSVLLWKPKKKDGDGYVPYYNLEYKHYKHNGVPSYAACASANTAAGPCPLNKWQRPVDTGYWHWHDKRDLTEDEYLLYAPDRAPAPEIGGYEPNPIRVQRPQRPRPRPRPQRPQRVTYFDNTDDLGGDEPYPNVTIVEGQEQQYYPPQQYTVDGQPYYPPQQYTVVDGQQQPYYPPQQYTVDGQPYYPGVSGTGIIATRPLPLPMPITQTPTQSLASCVQQRCPPSIRGKARDACLKQARQACSGIVTVSTASCVQQRCPPSIRGKARDACLKQARQACGQWYGGGNTKPQRPSAAVCAARGQKECKLIRGADRVKCLQTSKKLCVAGKPARAVQKPKRPSAAVCAARGQKECKLIRGADRVKCLQASKKLCLAGKPARGEQKPNTPAASPGIVWKTVNGKKVAYVRLGGKDIRAVKKNGKWVAPKGTLITRREGQSKKGVMYLKYGNVLVKAVKKNGKWVPKESYEDAPREMTETYLDFSGAGDAVPLSLAANVN